MIFQKAIPYLFLTIMLVAAAALINAGTTGTISGTITDKESGETLVGASVMVVGTNFGAMTDFDGRYSIRQLQPGTYRLRITSLNYASVEVDSVAVKAGQTSEISRALSKRSTELGVTITVKADRDIIDKFEISSRETVSKESVAKKPVTSVEELLGQVAGVVAGKEGKVFIRGGRAGEVGYVVDGVPLGDSRGSGSQASQAPMIDGVQYSAPQKIAPRRLQKCRDHRRDHPSISGAINGEPYDAMYFKNYGTNPFIDTEDDHLSTFAIDVDDASYVMMRSYFQRGHLPPSDAVRVEEFVNHFTYDYAPPKRRAFALHVEGAQSPFGQNSHLLKIGIKGREIRKRDRKPANLVFVVDVSGSMNRGNRLGLAKQGLTMMLDQLRPDDMVGIVTYGSNGRVVLEPTLVRGRGRRMIGDAIDNLRAGGSTYAEAGIRMGYQMADRSFEKGYINRVIVCSDGVANVGQTGPDEILQAIKRHAERGITLTTVGFGMGNYNDVLMEKLANKGNGQYAYIDDRQEARRFFVENLTGMLQVIARDVKIQVDFDPDIVRSYRLLGYENRDVADNKFRDDKEDGGEIGAGHQVTALYEIKLTDRRRGWFGTRDLGTIYVRYKDPDGDHVTEVKRTIERSVVDQRWERCSDDFRLATAAAEFAEILRHAYWARGSRPGDVLALVQGIEYTRDEKELREFIELVRWADSFDEEFAER
jgi:Ca-activated chloride channel family protein